MSEKQETVDDIIAEKRRRADEIERDCAEKMKRDEMVSDCYARELVADIRREADRLEAAHRRERGDAAKLREALKDIGRMVEQIRLLYSDYPYEIHVIARKASAALAAPPRHCDTMSKSVCATYFDALYNGNRDGVCMATTEREKNIHRYYCKYIKWLFATAKAKGDAK